MSYYQNFRIIIGNPFFKSYLKWAYRSGYEDFIALGNRSPFTKKNFSCLLCGVGTESTAELFIEFVINKNPKAKIFIIDIGKEQIDAVKKLVRKKYSHLNIKTMRTDALKLENYLKGNSIDWIETDFLFAFFNKAKLKHLFRVWNNILSDNGYITFRDSGTTNILDRTIDRIKIPIGKIWLGVDAYSHSLFIVRKMIKLEKFCCKETTLGIPYFKRYLLTKSV